MISYLFIFLASFVNGILDTQVFNEDNSVFTKLSNWWLPRKAYGKYPKVLGTTLDAYHLFKYFMILFIAISCVNYTQVLNKFNIFGTPVNLDVIAMFFVWGIGFELSRKIFKR